MLLATHVCLLQRLVLRACARRAVLRDTGRSLQRPVEGFELLRAEMVQLDHSHLTCAKSLTLISKAHYLSRSYAAAVPTCCPRSLAYFQSVTEMSWEEDRNCHQQLQLIILISTKDYN